MNKVELVSIAASIEYNIWSYCLELGFLEKDIANWLKIKHIHTINQYDYDHTN